jgi:hypothetical protein
LADWYFAACVAFAIVATIYWGAVAGRSAGESAGETAGRQAAIDHLAQRPAPAIVFHTLSMAKTTVYPGEPLSISYDYDKRAECTPQLGSGRFIYEAWTSTDEYIPILPIKLVDAQPAGYGQAIRDLAVTMSERPLRPGAYEFQISARFACKGEPSEQPPIKSQRIPFEVVPRPS